jgi:hypothetical protein
MPGRKFLFHDAPPFPPDEMISKVNRLLAGPENIEQSCVLSAEIKGESG